MTTDDSTKPSGNKPQLTPGIELRSPRMRRLLEHIPTYLTAWLTAISLLIISGVIIAAALLPYPHSDGESILQHLFN